MRAPKQVEMLLRLGHARISVYSDLGGCSGQEMIYMACSGVSARLAAARRTVPAVRHDDILPVPGIFLPKRFGINFDRIGTAGVFRLAVVIQIQFPAFPGPSRHFPAQCRNRRVVAKIVRAPLLRKAGSSWRNSHRRKFEHGGIGPAMLVIADQHPTGVSRQVVLPVPTGRRNGG